MKVLLQAALFLRHRARQRKHSQEKNIKSNDCQKKQNGSKETALQLCSGIPSTSGGQGECFFLVKLPQMYHDVTHIMKIEQMVKNLFPTEKCTGWELYSWCRWAMVYLFKIKSLQTVDLEYKSLHKIYIKAFPCYRLALGLSLDAKCILEMHCHVFLHQNCTLFSSC